MSKNKQHKIIKNDTVSPTQNTPVTLPGENKGVAKWIISVLLLTLICYSPMLSDEKQFTNWDDMEYITDQPLIQSLSKENIAKLFNPNTQVMSNYHPLTMLSFAIDYSIGYDDLDKSLDVKPFAVTNIIFHLLNTLLVFIFLFRLTNGKLWVAIFSSIIFGVHPMHVESVAWLSERKDLLYCFFFLLSCISYLRYMVTKKLSFLVLTFVLFVASCLCKAMAVPLPFVLLLIDFLYKQKLTARLILEKVPFILFALWIGYITIGHQEYAASASDDYSFAQHIMFACYSYCMYIYNFFIPVNLSALYPYPDVIYQDLPMVYYLTTILAPVIIALPVFFYIRKKSETSLAVLFGSFFYLLMIMLVMQFVTVGHAVMADRYTYVSYIGILFIVSTIIAGKIEIEKYRKATIALSAIFVLVCCTLTYGRISVWNNSETLWRDAISKNPYVLDETVKPAKVLKIGAKTAYKNLAHWYATNGQYDSAFIYYNTLAKFATADAEVWANLGNIYMLKKDLPNALKSYDTAILCDSTDFDTYFKRGLVHSFSGKNDAAIADLQKSILLNPGYEPAYIYACNLLLANGRNSELLQIAGAGTRKFPANADITYHYGAALSCTGKYPEAVTVLLKAIQLNGTKGNYYKELSACYDKLNQPGKAKEYADLAFKYGYKP